MANKKRGRPSTITIKVGKEQLKLADNNIKQILKTKIRQFQKSGAYIPISQNYSKHEAFVIVMENKVK